MRILLDENLDWRLCRYLPGFDVTSVGKMGWSGLKNGNLLATASREFDVLLTMDSSIPYQQDLGGLPLIVIGLRARTNRLADTAPLMPLVMDALDTAKMGQFIVVQSEPSLPTEVSSPPLTGEQDTRF